MAAVIITRLIVPSPVAAAIICPKTISTGEFKVMHGF